MQRKKKKMEAKGTRNSRGLETSRNENDDDVVDDDDEWYRKEVGEEPESRYRTTNEDLGDDVGDDSE